MINVQDYIGMVHTITGKRFKQFGHKYDYKELFQNGCVGLMIAAKRFDESKNIRFTTFAHIQIDGYILRCIRDDKWYMGKRKDRGTAKAPACLDAPMDNSKENGNTFISQTANEDNSFENAELMVLLDNLPNKLKKIIKLRYFSGFTQMEVAKILGFAQVSVSRYERKALNILREEMLA